MVWNGMVLVRYCVVISDDAGPFLLRLPSGKRPFVVTPWCRLDDSYGEVVIPEVPF
jgi:hypothetical protein